MTTEQDKKRNLALKIKALLAKTVSAGCTEEEALSSFQKAHELLETYQMDLSDLDIREEGTQQTETHFSEVANKLAVRVAKYCDCETWSTSKHELRGKGRRQKWETVRDRIKFIGLKTDADFAEWLLFALTSYVEGREMSFLFSDGNEKEWGDTSTLSFTDGCIKRINERLRDETAKRASARSTGRDLVPLKNAMVREAIQRAGIQITYGTFQYNERDSNAFAAGKRAGDGVSFNRPMSDNRETQKRLS